MALTLGGETHHCDKLKELAVFTGAATGDLIMILAEIGRAHV